MPRSKSANERRLENYRGEMKLRIQTMKKKKIMENMDIALK
jgi:hypothetical protein